MNFKTTIAALAVAASSMAATSASSLTVDGFTYTPNSPAVFGLQALELSAGGNTDSAATNNDLNINTALGGNLVNTSAHGGSSVGTSSGSIAFKFTNAFAGGAITAVNLSTNNPLNSFSGLQISWCSGFAAGACVGELNSITQPIGGQSLGTTFAATGEMQFLVATWDSVPNTPNQNVDFNITTTVPVPAGILLMGTALAGFGVMRRRKKEA